MSDRLRLISHPFHNELESVDMGAAPLASARRRLCARARRRHAYRQRLIAFDRFHVAAAPFTAYDPALYADGRTAGAAAAVIRTIGHRALSQ